MPKACHNFDGCTCCSLQCLFGKTISPGYNEEEATIDQGSSQVVKYVNYGHMGGGGVAKCS